MVSVSGGAGWAGVVTRARPAAREAATLLGLLTDGNRSDAAAGSPAALRERGTGPRNPWDCR